jgi:hypothetical protein
VSQPLIHSDVESRRFGLSVARAVFTGDVPAKEILEQVFRERIDVAILRIPAEKSSEAAAFERRGIPTVTSDTLVYYFADMEKTEPNPLRNSDLSFERLGPSNVHALDALVETTFAGYISHYSANPFLRSGLLPGYLEWARSFAGDDPERFGWLASRDGEPAAFATCSCRGEEGEGVLYGVSPDASGGGVYGDLIRFTQRALKDAGCSTMKVSTQVQNFAVQKVWSREGFVMKEAYTTIHLNALLSASVVPKRTLPLVVTAEYVDEFGRASGDLNPLHFDDQAARELGFEERIAHGVIATGFLSKFYGTDFPGKGTIFAGFRCTFSRPVYLGREYSVEISFPFHDPGSGRWLSLARIFDPEGKPCLLAYAELVNKNVGQDQARAKP